MIAITTEDIYKEYAKMVFAFLLSMCKDYHLAEDLTQDTFLKAYTHIESYDETKKMSTWLCAIAKNLYIDYTRKNKNQEIPVDILPEGTQEPANESSDSGTSISTKEIMRLVHSLDEPYKEVFLLRYSMGLSFSEIADIFGQKEGWARLVYHRSRKQLQKKIKEMSV